MVAGTILAQMALSGEESFISGIEDASDEMGDSVRSASRLSRAYDSLGDEATGAIPGITGLSAALSRADDQADDASGSSRRAARAFGTLSAGTEGISARIGGMTTSTRGLIGVLGTLAAIAVPLGATIGTLAAGFAAVAGVFGLIIGSGIVAWGKGFQTALKNVQKEIMPLIKSFGKQFIPLLKDAINALPGLVRAIINALGPMDQFKSALRTLGQLAVRILPKLVGLFFDLAEFALPIVVKLGKFLMNNLVPALNSIFSQGMRSMGVIQRLAPAFRALFRSVKAVLPALVPLGKALFDIGVMLVRAATKITTQFIPSLKPIIRIVTQIANTIKWFGQLVLPIFVSLADFLQDQLTITFRNLGKTVKTIFGTIASVFGITEKRTKGSVKGMVNTLRNILFTAYTDMFVLVNKTLRRIRKWWVRHEKQIREVLIKLRNAAMRIINKLLGTLRKQWERHGSEIMDSVNQLVSFLRWAFKKIKQFVTWVWSTMGDEIMAYARFFTDGIIAVIGAFTDTILTAFDVFTDILAGDWESAWKKIKGLVSRLANGILRFIKKWGGRLINWVKTDLKPTVVNWFDQMAKDAKNAVTGWINDLISWLKNDAVNDLSNAASSLGDAIASSLKGGFNAVLNDVPIPSVTIGQGVPGPDYTIGGGTLDVPQLAEGAIVTGPTLAMIGEAGPEKVQPLGSRDERTGTGSAEAIARAIRQALRNLSLGLRIGTDDDALAEWVANEASLTIEDEMQSALDAVQRRNRGGSGI